MVVGDAVVVVAVDSVAVVVVVVDPPLVAFLVVGDVHTEEDLLSLTPHEYILLVPGRLC